MHIAIQRTDPGTALPWTWIVSTACADEIDSGTAPEFGTALHEALEAFRVEVDWQDVTITRENQQVDTIYVGDWAPQARPFRGRVIFVTHDGIGRVYYDSVNQARADRGDDLPVIYVKHIED